MQLLTFAYVLFKLWMVIDAMQRGGTCCNPWLWITLMIPGGEVAYFLVVKIHDPQLFGLGKTLFKRAPSLQSIEYLASHCPSIENKTKLVEALLDAKQPQRALPLIDELLAGTHSDRRMKYLHAICLIDLNRPAEALSDLESLTEKELSFEGYRAAITMASVHKSLGDATRSLEVLKRVAAQSQQLDHLNNYAQTLIGIGQTDLAAGVLQRAIIDYKHSPDFVRRRERKALRRAKQILRQCNCETCRK